ncbi:MAG: hypothetical protein AMXMBFR34_11840 [Myxococcaceae bacterium]
MRSAALLGLLLLGCAGPRAAQVRDEGEGYAVRDYLTTAWEALSLAETDTAGHRVRAQRETRAALEALGDLATPIRRVPFDGPPSLEVALELLERSRPHLGRNALAMGHAEKAMDELRAAMR